MAFNQGFNNGNSGKKTGSGGGGATSLGDLSDCTIATSDPTASTNPSAVGHVFINSTSGEVFVCTDATAGANVWTNIGEGVGNLLPGAWYGSRGVVLGGVGSSGSTNNIDYFTIQSPSNAASFGTLTISNNSGCAFSDGSRGVSAGGWNGVNNTTIDYITIATTGNAQSFGSLYQGAQYCSGMSDGTRGIVAGGRDSWVPVWHNVIQYVTIATTGNSVDFGDMVNATNFSSSACNDATRGVIFPSRIANSTAYTTAMEYITIATTGNAVFFGDVTTASYRGCGFSGEGRGVVHLGVDSSNIKLDVLEYITIATTGNSVDFGDLSSGRSSTTGTSDGFTGVVAGGYSTIHESAMEYITIATTGNAQSFGSLTQAIYSGMSTSGA